MVLVEMGIHLYKTYILFLVHMTSLKDQIPGFSPQSSIKFGCIANWNILETIVKTVCNDVSNAKLSWARNLEKTGHNMVIGLN
jgi:hypothetical protein